ncbi:MAG TPA: phosphoadenylyl-sulfate reductase [Vicinamibacterales bacterium]|nr:phosphoadenylyl-sulfate reductase [Vicinamibacterales bacterium]
MSSPQPTPNSQLPTAKGESPEPIAQGPAGVAELADHATRVIAEALAAGSLPCITNSFQAEDMVLTHLVREQNPDVPVLFLETFHHFPQTLAYRDEMAKEWGMTLVVLKAAEPQIGLWQTSTEACCARHKVGPLFAALANYDTWFAGLRREQSPSRANLQENEPFKLPNTTIRRVSPLAAWTTRDVWRYAKAHGIRLLPLYDEGYTSIGCEPCTSLPLDPNNPRSGRWGGQKLECGIHIQAK